MPSETERPLSAHWMSGYQFCRPSAIDRSLTVLTTFTATASDPDGGSLTFSLGAGAPAGASITPAGVFTWTPTAAQAGNVYNIKVIVTDNNIPGLTDSEVVAITVVFNPAPVLVSATINDGFAYRSCVSSIVLQFSE